MKRFHLMLLGIALGTCMFPATAADFTVTDPTEFQAALDTAASNGEDDTISVASGTYHLASPLTFTSLEGYTLTVNGVTGSTILDGSDSSILLQLTATQAGAHLTLTNLVFQHGANAGPGGALNIECESGDITVQDCEFSDNHCDGVGGALAVNSNTGTITLQNCLVQRNTSSSNVGGAFCSTQSGHIDLIDSEFRDNTVNNTGGSPYYGDAGGAQGYTDSHGSVTVSGCLFHGNLASGGDNPDGGGLMLYQLGTGVTAEVTQNTFTDNQAGLGGAGCFIRMNGSGSVTFSENQLSGNDTLSAYGDGGGAFIYVDQGSSTLSDNHFWENHAEGSGGGLWLRQGEGSATITGDRCEDNQATDNGGGMHVSSDSGTITVIRCQFAENTAGNVGAGLDCATGTGHLVLDHCTFYGNDASDGGGLYAYLDQAGATYQCRNLIFWHDTPNALAHSSGSGSGSFSITHSDAEGGAGESWFGTGCFDADPLFADALNHDLAITWANYPVHDATESPCIDNGDPASPLDPDGTPADVGAIPFDQTVPGQPTHTEVLIFARQDQTSLPVTPTVLDPDPEDTHTFEVLTDPAHGNVEPTPDERQLLLTPTPGYTGMESFTYRAIDPGGLSVQGTGQILVQPDALFVDMSGWPDPDVLYFIPYMETPYPQGPRKNNSILRSSMH